MVNKLHDLSHLQRLCQKYHLYPSKKYGQNFLINPEPIERMLESAQLSKDDVVIEVGSGFGVLTLSLSEKVKKVYSFEIEKKLQPYWEDQIKKYPNIEIIWGNVLKQFSEITMKQWSNETMNYKVIANLPYQITSPVIRLFLENENPPETMVLMVQKEVAERICAKPGDMSVLSVAVQYYSTPEYIMTVSRSYFWPVPQVDSAIIRLSKIKIPIDISQEKFFRLVKAGFSSRRKILVKNLLSLIDKERKADLEMVFKKLGLSEKVRAQELSVDKWKIITNHLLGIK